MARSMSRLSVWAPWAVQPCLLSARGVKAIGIDAYYPAHAFSSSHGEIRLIRRRYIEDPSYVPLLQRANENWRALEARLRSGIVTVTTVLGT